MKIASYILSFYFISLVGVACTDTVPVERSQNAVSVSCTNDSNHGHSQESGLDGCSLLCVCHCCHVHFVSVLGLVFTHPTKLPNVYTSYLQDFMSIEISGFLKPPRS
ncbi:DUF6660 family protein [uncultured Imperialibacter sp.]|uniref:DUF6660 family protein n=1 Tax=Imperialibacter sp. TaxID=2038411 RepID=UPI0030DA2FC4